jgi:hypothetical protein
MFVSSIICPNLVQEFEFSVRRTICVVSIKEINLLLVKIFDVVLRRGDQRSLEMDVMYKHLSEGPSSSNQALEGGWSQPHV